MIEYKCLTVRGKLNCFTARVEGNVGVLGERYSGKEEIVKATFRLVKAEGEVLIDGVDALKISNEELNRLLWTKVSLVTYDPKAMFNPIYDIASHFVEVSVSHGLGGSSCALELAKEALKVLGEKEEVLYMYPHQLSTFRLKRVAIALALFTEPEHVFVEDIEYGLSELERAYIVNSLIDAMSSYISKYVVFDNDPAVLSRLVDYVYVVYKGEVIEEGSEVLTRPMHPYTVDYLDGVVRDSEKGQGCIYSNACRFSSPKCREETPNTFRYPGGAVKCNLYPWRGQ